MSLIHNERTKLTAAYLNTAATGFFGAGVVAPLAAAVFGLTGPGSPVSTLTLGLGILIFLVASIAIHLAARYALKGLKP
jgi:hypothetical protein